jgi:flagellar biosynthesis protein FlhF
MRVKKYIVDSMPEALQKIRIELGKDAVIINTKQIRVGGFLGLFSKKKIEVVAATDIHPPSTSTVKTTPTQVPMQQPMQQPVPQQVPFIPVQSSIQYPVNQTQASSMASDDTLLKEMKQMKEMMLRLTTPGTAVVQDETDAANRENLINDLFARMQAKLIKQDVRPDLAASIIKEVSSESKDKAGKLTNFEAKQAVVDRLVKILTKQPIEPIHNWTRMIHFVGPTGVGKTTTIAKLAAEQVLKYRKSVGLITSDTYRIAAIDQLRTYASILDVPLEVVFSPLDLQKAMEKMQDKDIILMDTAGRNFRSDMAVSELQSLLRTDEKRDTILVLSLCMKYSDMHAVMDKFNKFGVEKVLFTKSDETETIGSIINLFSDFSLSLSYITDGQNVPEDIRLADPRTMANELVGELDDE